MRAGQLDRSLIVERSTRIRDETGNYTNVWSLLARRRAHVLQSSTEEFVRNYAVTADRIVIFRIRYLAGLRLSDRITYENEQFTLKEVKELGRRRGLELRTVRAG